MLKEIVADGIDDNVLNKSPVISFVKIKYRKYTTFSNEPTNEQPDNIQQIHNLEPPNILESVECSICLEQVTNIIKTTCGCSTVYCNDCFNKIFATNKTCTVCKNMLIIGYNDDLIEDINTNIPKRGGLLSLIAHGRPDTFVF